MEYKTCEEYVLGCLEDCQNRLEDLQHKYITLLTEYEKLKEEKTGSRVQLNEEAPRGC